MQDLKPETLAVHAARAPDPATGAVAPPLHLSTTFERAPDGGYPHGFQYGRSGNPTRDALEQAIAALEGAEGSDVAAMRDYENTQLKAWTKR